MSDEKKIRIGLMGGTFDPIHYGHLVTAEAAREKFVLDEVVFVPSGNPPHKKETPISAAEHRLMMVTMATISNPDFHVSTMELKRPGFSYTFDTVNEFLRQYNNKCEIYFITGADAVLEITSWKDVEALMEKCYFIAATRPGFNLDELYKLPPDFLAKIRFMQVPALAISSTDIRRRVAYGESIKYLLPESVENYIYKQKLYLNP